ncbi:retinol dehydrogenase 12-like [Anthonomus grandis grandis]|uniref:retinol dehydrogenase 12-like n=1 Tax=Anthonomus grandis grandis TaxID=2921223 RepID=UPI0021659A5E|nr:retinol dehydrogenase 12-like [Anthonomus grandis grandis]
MWLHLISAVLFIIIAVIAAKLYVKLTTGWCYSNVCLIGKTVIITGANSGLGYEAALDFAKRGARVILACRNAERGLNAQLKKMLDVASLKSVREFANDINKTESRLDILLNNAGGLYLEPKMTEDNLLLMMATNHFGPFLLTNLLLDLMKKTSNARIVNVSSVAATLFRPKLYVTSTKLFNETIGQGSDWEIYARTKLCNILFTIELAKRLKGTSVTTYALHPGIIVNDVFRNTPFYMLIPLKYVARWILKDSLEGAQTSIYCSIAQGIEPLSGGLFEDCSRIAPYVTTQIPGLSERLWEISEELVKLG